MEERKVMCIDLKGFYASCECVMRGLDPMSARLAVVGSLKRQGSIVLAITPAVKKIGVKTRCRFYELPKDKGIIMAPARMRTYLEFSQRIVKIFLKYVPVENLHIYSVDESFLDVTETYHLFSNNERELAGIIMADIEKETGLPSAAGIGSNMLLAKLALDLEAKKMPDNIALWGTKDVEEKLWPVTPLSEMWGIGANLEKALNEMGIFSVGDLAHTDISKLKEKFGILGEELYYHSHGIDLSRIDQPYQIKSHNFSVGQTLFQDYYEDIEPVMLEQVEELAMRIRQKRKMGRTVHLSINYSRDIGGGGFSRQVTLDEPTNLTSEIYAACLFLFHKYYDGRPIRKLTVNIGQISDDHTVQLDLFTDRFREKQLAYSVDEIRQRFGKASILRGISYLDHSTALRRSKLIGGHYADLKFHEE